MFHEEKVILDVLCYRKVPLNVWIRYSQEQLTEIIHELRREIALLREGANDENAL